MHDNEMLGPSKLTIYLQTSISLRLDMSITTVFYLYYMAWLVFLKSWLQKK